MHSHLDTCITPKTQGFRTSKGSMCFIKTRCIHSKCNRWQSAASSGDSSCNNPAMFVAHFPTHPVNSQGHSLALFLPDTLHKEFRQDISFLSKRLLVFSTRRTASQHEESPERNCSIQTENEITSLNETLSNRRILS